MKWAPLVSSTAVSSAFLAFLAACVVKPAIALRMMPKVADEAPPQRADIAAHWEFPDGSPPVGFSEFRGMDELHIPEGEPIMMRYVGESSMSSGRHDWSMNVVFDGMASKAKGVMFGVTTEECFKASSNGSLKGMLFDGFHLTDGETNFEGYRKIDGFNPSRYEHHTIQMIVDIQKDLTKIYFIQEARPLGLAYEFPTEKDKSLYPVVRFGGGKVKMLFAPQRAKLPDDFMTRSNAYLSPHQSLWGLWRLVSTSDPDLVPLAGVDFLVEPRGTNVGRLSIKAKVVNLLEATLTGNEMFAIDTSGTILGDCEVEVTKVGEEPSSDAEKRVLSFLEGITTFKAFRKIHPDGEVGTEQIIVNGKILLERAEGQDDFVPIKEYSC